MTFHCCDRKLFTQ